MTSIGERSFHLIMGGLVLASLFLDELVRRAGAPWNMPTISLLTFVLGLVWLGRHATHRGELTDERLRVLQDRLDRAERKLDALEAADAAARRLPGGLDRP